MPNNSFHRRTSIHPFKPPIRPTHPFIQRLATADTEMQDKKSYERSRAPSSEFYEQNNSEQCDAANDHEKNVRSLETRRPLQECLQAQGQHVPRAHASSIETYISSVSDADTVTSAAEPSSLQTYVVLFVLHMSLTFFLLQKRNI